MKNATNLVENDAVLAAMLQDNRAGVLADLTQRGWALYSASEALRDDKEIILAAVTPNGYALRHASEGMQNDEDMSSWPR